MFTVNFDTMFEEACLLLSIPFRVYLPDDAPPSLDGLNHLPICKLHGSIQSETGEFMPQSLRTTMSGITMSNDRWGDFLQGLMTKVHLTLAGYSGRDVDYYPHIRSCAIDGGGLRPFWFGQFQGFEKSNVAARETAKRAGECGAALVIGYPSKHLGDAAGPLYYTRLVDTTYAAEIWSRTYQGLSEREWKSLERAKNALLDSLVVDQTKAEVPEDLLWLRILTDTGHCAEALELANEMMEDLERYNLSESQQLSVLTDGMNMAREQAMYGTYRKRAKQLRRLAGRRFDRIGFALNAQVQVTSSYMMEIPPDLPFSPSVNVIDLIRFLRVLFRMQVSDPLAFELLALQHKDHAKGIRDSPILAEFRIRRFAIWLRLLSKLKLTRANDEDGNGILAVLQRRTKNALISYLERQFEMARHAGNYQTMISACKYLFRITQTETWRAQGEEVALMSSDYSALAIFRRDKKSIRREPPVRSRAYAQVVAPDYRAEEREKERAVQLSRENGNILNEIKCLVGLAEFRFSHRLELGEPLLLSADEDNRLRELVELIGVESPRLGRYFRETQRNIRKVSSPAGGKDVRG